MSFLVVDRQRFRLEFWLPRAGNGFERVNKLGIAVGAIGHATPRGVYEVVRKSVTPDWLAPNAEWVPVELRGKTFTIDSPHNPFAGGFISLAGPQGAQYNGLGIHGTKFDPEIGTRASHGCIRMSVPDFRWVYDRVALGDAVAVF